jgi:hypothetical protein
MGKNRAGDTSRTPSFPRRDADGRIEYVVDLLGITLAGLVLGVLILLVIDGGAALLGLGTFGRASGWLAAVLPGWLFIEEVRAWRGVRWRLLLTLVAALVAVLLGIIAAGTASFLPPLASGAVGATVAAVAYALVWFYGIRLAGRDV